MNFLRNLFGKKEPQVTPSSTARKQQFSGMTSQRVREMLNSIRPDGSSLYDRDRDEAFRWHRQKGFPSMDHNTKVGVNWYTSMSQRADDESLWQEAWAGYHHALAGCLHLEIAEEIPDVMWHLGRAHTGQGQYDLAALYLQAGQRLSEEQNNTQLTSRLLLEDAVLAKLAQQPSVVQDAMGRVFANLFPSGQASPLATQAAMTLFQEGMKNQKWRSEGGQSIKSCLVHATGFYEVGLELNRKLNDKRGIAFTLINLGDVWRKLNKKDRALVCWREALTYLTELGDQQNIRLVNRWISEV